MFTSMIIGLCGAAAVAAVPHPFGDYVSEGKVMVATETGTTQLIDLDVYLEGLSANNISLKVPEIDVDFLNFTVDVNVDINELDKRQGCDHVTYVTVDTTQNFVDWDVQMSPVACATDNSQDITVTNGFSLANSVGVSAGMDRTLIADKLSASFGVDYQYSWTTSTLIANKGTVSSGSCGVMITKPLTTRRYGKIWQGCIGSGRVVGSFMADAHTSASYGGVKWVSGAISMCSKRQNNPPLSRCTGTGNFV